MSDNDTNELTPRQEALSNYEEYFGIEAREAMEQILASPPDAPPTPPDAPESEQVVGSSVQEMPMDHGGRVGDPSKVDTQAIAEREEALLNAIIAGRRADVDRLATRSSHGRKR